MKILGIETSCDETALSLIEASGDLRQPKFKVVDTALYSQIEAHRPFGGVFPSLAKREHSQNLIPLLTSLLEDKTKAKKTPQVLEEETTQTLTEIFSREPELLEHFLKYIPTREKPDLDFIAVTSGPGLEPALWVGINFARALSLIWQIPVLPVNHMEGHMVSVLSEKSPQIHFPAISLLISGGHTEIILIKNWGNYTILGSTKDDAVGEAFDKVARILEMPYPGGPEISRLANLARKNEFFSNSPEVPEIKLPRPMISSKDYHFSFSGLKTAVLYLVKKLTAENELTEEIKQRIALEFEEAVTEVLFTKTSRALKEFGARTCIIGGGVIANKHIRETFAKLKQEEINVLVPEVDLTTDNATMIAMAGFLKSFRVKPEMELEILANGNLKF